MGGFKDKGVSLFKTNTPKQTVYRRGQKLSKPIKQNIKIPFVSEENKKIRTEQLDIFWYFLRQKKKKKDKNKNIINRLIKDKIIRDIRTLFEEQEDNYKPKSVSSFWNNNYFEYNSNGDKIRDLSLDEHLNKVKPYLRDTIVNLQSSDTWKNHLTIAIDFISWKDTKEKRVMHSTSGNIKFIS